MRIPVDFAPFERTWLERSIAERFEFVAARRLHEVAVSAADGTLTYRELRAWANRLAHAIHRSGRGTTAAVIVEQGAAVAVAILGILKAGLAYVPLEGHYPDARLVECVTRAEASVVVADEANAPRCRGLFPHAVIINVEDLPGGLSDDGPVVGGRAEHHAYIYFTSGSTGRPKAVVDNHRNVLHNVMRYTNALAIGASDRLTLVQTPGFSGAVSSLFCALLNGAQSCPVDLRAIGLGHTFASWVADRGITVYHSTPSIFRALAQHGDRFPSVRVIRLEGDAASILDVELYRRHFSEDCVLANGLGATETGISCQFFVNPSTVLADGVLPIGFPAADMKARVVDADGRDVPRGVAGEIVIESQYLAVGYWRDPEVTARSFVDAADGRRAYRTGDLGRFGADGALAYLGRVDAQMKVGGERVDPVEVESAILMTPGVLEAVAVVQLDADGAPRLVAFITTSQPPPSLKLLRRTIGARLPDTLMPSAFVRLESLPLSDNRKVDRGQLPQLSQCTPLRDSVPYVAPRSDTEVRIARLWATVLSITPVGAHDDFFELGGDSLKAASFASRLERDCGVAVPLSLLLESPTVEALAARIDSGDMPRDSYAGTTAIRART